MAARAYTSEADMRRSHVIDALHRALKAAYERQWFEAISAIQEAEIIARVVKEQS